MYKVEETAIQLLEQRDVRIRRSVSRCLGGRLGRLRRRRGRNVRGLWSGGGAEFGLEDPDLLVVHGDG